MTAALTDSTPLIREFAADILGELRYSSTGDSLLTAAEDDLPQVRVAARRALAKIGDPNSIPALFEGVHDPGRYGEGLASLQTKRAIEWHLENRACAAALLSILDSDDDTKIALAITVLRRLHTFPSCGKIIDLLVNRNSHVRLNTLEALFRGSANRDVLLRTPVLIDTLLTLLDSTVEVDEVRNSAARALGLSGSPKALSSLIQHLETNRVCIAAAKGLGYMGDPAGVNALLSKFRITDNSGLAEAIVQALCSILSNPKRNHIQTNVLNELAALEDKRIVNRGHGDVDDWFELVKCDDVRRSAREVISERTNARGRAKRF